MASHSTTSTSSAGQGPASKRAGTAERRRHRRTAACHLSKTDLTRRQARPGHAQQRRAQATADAMTRKQAGGAGTGQPSQGGRGSTGQASGRRCTAGPAADLIQGVPPTRRVAQEGLQGDQRLCRARRLPHPQLVCAHAVGGDPACVGAVRGGLKLAADQAAGGQGSGVGLRGDEQGAGSSSSSSWVAVSCPGVCACHGTGLHGMAAERMWMCSRRNSGTALATLPLARTRLQAGARTRGCGCPK